MSVNTGYSKPSVASCVKETLSPNGF